MLLRTHTKSFPLFHTPDEGKSRQNRQVSGIAATLQLFSGHNVSLVRQHKVPIEAYLFRNRVLSVENCNLFCHNINIYTLKASKGNNLATMCCRNFCAQLSVTWRNLLCPKAKRMDGLNEFSFKCCGKCAHFFVDGAKTWP